MIAACGTVAATADTNGDFSWVDSFTWTTSTHAIDGKLVPGEIQTTTNYGENTFATGGQSSFNKLTDFNTANANANSFNVDARKIFSFNGLNNGTQSGHATSSEEIGFDTAGKPKNSPWFHNSVSAGGSFDLVSGSVATSAQTRTVSETSPLALAYSIGVQGLGDGPAIGSASSFMNGHLEQSRINSTKKSSDLVFSHQSSASGLINVFTDKMSYEEALAAFGW